MIARRVLLVTGARSLADDPRAEAWARDLIRAALDGVDTLFVGDAPGPDSWAFQIARADGVETRRYCAGGSSAGLVEVATGGADGPTRTRVCQWSTGADHHPLKRNAAMVMEAKLYRVYGQRDVRVLALIDGRKTSAKGRVTRGTEHTAGLAQRAGLTVDRRTWNEVTP